MDRTQPTAPDLQYPTAADYNKLVNFRRYSEYSAGALYVTVDDVLILRVQTTAPPTLVQVSVRLQTPDGQIIPMFRALIAPGGLGTVNSFVLELVEGFLLSVTVATPGTSQGVAFCSVEIQRGQGSADTTGGHLLCAGYPGTNWKIGFPQTPAASPLAGAGAIQSFTIGPPPVGNEVIATLPAGVQWIVRAFHVSLTTAIAVANRIPTFQLNDAGGNVVYRLPIVAAQAASLTQEYSWTTDINNVLAPPAFSAALPNDFRLQPGWTLRTNTTALQAADQFSIATLMVESFVNA